MSVHMNNGYKMLICVELVCFMLFLKPLTNHLAYRCSQRISMSKESSHFYCKYCV